MYRMLVLVMAAGVLAWSPADARADAFGGFSADQSRYLAGRDKVCTPVPVAEGKGRGVPGCEQADAGQVAALKFRRGMVQQGAQAEYEASFRGTVLTITARREGRVVLTWEALDPIARIEGVYLSEGRALLAVTYQSRTGGRARTDTVGFALAAHAPPAGARPESGRPPAPDAPADTPAGTPGAGASSGQPAGSPADASAADPATAPADPRVPKLLDRARRLDKQGARAAEAGFRQVLAIDPGHPEAGYGLARSLARQNQRAGAVDALRALAAAGRPDAITWLVEARFDPAFAKLRADPGFRAATGLDRDPARPQALYERLVGFTSAWEQPEIKCEQAQVVLDLERLARTFRLRIVSRCGGHADTTRLSGSWRLPAADRVDLVFPNPQGPDEILDCRMERCPGGEDCLRCGADTDMAFTLRPVRR